MDVEKCVLGTAGINVCILGLTTGLAFGFAPRLPPLLIPYHLQGKIIVTVVPLPG